MMNPVVAPPTGKAEFIHANNLRNNMSCMSFVRTFASLLTGIFVGILGIEGWWGFLPHFATQLLCAPLMFVKGATPPNKYFHSWSNFWLSNVFASTTLLTYILAWMIFYNLCHVF